MYENVAIVKQNDDLNLEDNRKPSSLRITGHRNSKYTA